MGENWPAGYSRPTLGDRYESNRPALAEGLTPDDEDWYTDTWVVVQTGGPEDVRLLNHGWITGDEFDGELGWIGIGSLALDYEGKLIARDEEQAQTALRAWSEAPAYRRGEHNE